MACVLGSGCAKQASNVNVQPLLEIVQGEAVTCFDIVAQQVEWQSNPEVFVLRFGNYWY